MVRNRLTSASRGTLALAGVRVRRAACVLTVNEGRDVVRQLASVSRHPVAEIVHSSTAWVIGELAELKATVRHLRRHLVSSACLEKQWDFAGLDTNRIGSGSAPQIRIDFKGILKRVSKGFVFFVLFPRAAKRQRGPKRPAHSRRPAARSLLYGMLR